MSNHVSEIEQETGAVNLPMPLHESENHVVNLSGKMSFIPQTLRVEDAVDDDEQDAWDAYKMIEPLYSTTNRLLADG